MPRPNRIHFIRCLVCDEERNSQVSISFFKFPSNQTIRDMWVDFCIACGVMVENDRNFKFTGKNIFICSQHFQEEDLRQINRAGIKQLKKFAVPRIIEPGVYYAHAKLPEEVILNSGNKKQVKTSQVHILDESEEIISDINSYYIKQESLSDDATGEPEMAQLRSIRVGSFLLNEETQLLTFTDETNDGVFSHLAEHTYASSGAGNNTPEETIYVLDNAGDQPTFAEVKPPLRKRKKVSLCDRKRYALTHFTDRDLEDPNIARQLRTLALNKSLIQNRKLKVMSQKCRRLEKKLLRFMPYIRILKKNKMLPNCLTELEISVDNPLIVNTSFVDVEQTSDLSEDELGEEKIELELVDCNYKSADLD
ncbi:uncharacterized protein [Euwallacea similis]|uniref:uncharacterized protein isoform X1 n=1 Tax=Euwallacea similis TaxID=1736056 RepID=UPI00344D513C